VCVEVFLSAAAIPCYFCGKSLLPWGRRTIVVLSDYFRSTFLAGAIGFGVILMRVSVEVLVASWSTLLVLVWVFPAMHACLYVALAASTDIV